jgi:hypothetical protein
LIVKINGNNFPIKRLNSADFASALRKGQGRAKLHVIRFGLEDVKDLVLEACLRNQVYDQQLESGRGDWLFSMFRDSSHFPEFRNAILKALETETDSRNYFQLCHLAWEFADLGDGEARRIFGKNVYRMASDPNIDVWPVADWWVELEGAAGFLELARIYGKRLLADPNAVVFDLHSHFEDHPEYREMLEEYSPKAVAINAYRKYLEGQADMQTTWERLTLEEKKQENHLRVREKYTVQGILNDAKKGVGKLPGRYLTFGMHATAEEMEQVYAVLVNETQNPVRVRLLWVFRRARLPRLDDILLEWAVAADDDLRAASIAALAQVSDERVHRLARLKTAASNLLGADHESLKLFMQNYEPEDAALIMKSLAGLRTIREEDSNELGFNLIELAVKYQDPGLADGIRWVYENAPCGFHRYRAVDWLNKFGLFTDALRFECQYDANADIREFAG